MGGTLRSQTARNSRYASNRSRISSSCRGGSTPGDVRGGHKWFAHLCGRRANAETSIVWLDRTGQPTPAISARAGFQQPRLSPDGKRVRSQRRRWIGNRRVGVRARRGAAQEVDDRRQEPSECVVTRRHQDRLLRHTRGSKRPGFVRCPLKRRRAGAPARPSGVSVSGGLVAGRPRVRRRAAGRRA